MQFDLFDAKMRQHEMSFDQFIPTGMWPLIRLNVRATRQLQRTMNFENTFDLILRDALLATVETLMVGQFRGIYSYIEKDAVSILFAREDDSFQRKIRKWLTVLAAESSSRFTHILGVPASFDARLIPACNTTTIIDYFRWRQEYFIRNSLDQHCCFILTKRQYNRKQAGKMLIGLSLEEKIFLLLQQGYNYTKDIPRWCRLGLASYWLYKEKIGKNPLTGKEVKARRRFLFHDPKLPTGREYEALIKKSIN